MQQLKHHSNRPVLRLSGVAWAAIVVFVGGASVARGWARSTSGLVLVGRVGEAVARVVASAFEALALLGCKYREYNLMKMMNVVFV